MNISFDRRNLKTIVEIRALKSVFNYINSESLESHLNIATPVTVSFDQSQASILTDNFEFDA